MAIKLVAYCNQKMTRYIGSMRVGKTFRNYFYGPILQNKKLLFFIHWWGKGEYRQEEGHGNGPVLSQLVYPTIYYHSEHTLQY